MVTKYSSRLFSQLLDVEDGEMSQTGISITQLRDIYFNKFVHNKKNWKAVLQHARDLILWIPVTKKMGS